MMETRRDFIDRRGIDLEILPRPHQRNVTLSQALTERELRDDVTFRMSENPDCVLSVL